MTFVELRFLVSFCLVFWCSVYKDGITHSGKKSRVEGVLRLFPELGYKGWEGIRCVYLEDRRRQRKALSFLV